MKLEVVEKVDLIKDIEFPPKVVPYFSVDIHDFSGCLQESRDFMKYEDALEYYKSVCSVAPVELKLYADIFYDNGQSDLEAIDLSCNYTVTETRETNF